MATRGQPPLSVRLEMARMYERGQLSAHQIRNLEMDTNDRSEIRDRNGVPANDPAFENEVSTNTSTYVSPWAEWAARKGYGGVTPDFETLHAVSGEIAQVGTFWYVPAAALADPLGYGLPSSVVHGYMASNPGATAAQAAAALLPTQSINSLLGRSDDALPPGGVLHTLGGAPPYTPTLPLGTMSTLAPAGGAGGFSPIVLIGLAAGAYLLLRR